MILLFALLIGHALCDYPLQGDFIGKFKSHKVPSPMPNGETVWPILLASHALIHAGAVWIITGSWQLAFLEYVLHCLIDFAKSAGWTNFKTDQLLHVCCKIFYCVVLGWKLDPDYTIFRHL